MSRSQTAFAPAVANYSTLGLPVEMRRRIRAVYAAIGSYLGTTEVEFASGFRAQHDSANELVVWCCIVAAWQAFQNTPAGRALSSPCDKQQQIVSLIMLSTGVRDDRSAGLSTAAAVQLAACYDQIVHGAANG